MTATKLFVVAALVIAATMAWSVIRMRLARRQFERDPDAVQLEGRELDPNREYLFEFSIYVPSRSAASQVSDSVKRLGYGASIEELTPGGDWECMATKRVPGNHDALLAVRRELRDIAASAGGSYEYWEILEGEASENAV